MRRWGLALVLAIAAAAVQAAQVQVAVAANMAAPMRKIAAGFARASGHEAVVVIGSTGQLYAQIRAGAPFDVLLAADDETPARLEQDGLAVRDSRFTYATGQLVLWSADPAAVDPQGEVLRRPPEGRLAVANPKLAPYGFAAMETLTQLGVLPAWTPHLVQGESIGQAYQFAATRNARYAFVALSQVMADGRIATGSAWIVPASLHGALRQDAVLLKKGQGNPAAVALMAYLRSDAARAVLRGYGYTF